MAFQDEIRDSLADMMGQLVPADKKADFEAGFAEKLAPVFDKMGKVFEESSKSLAQYKAKVRELEGSRKPEGNQGDSDEYRKALQELEAKEKALEELSSQHGTTVRERKELEKQFKATAERLERESAYLNETVRAAELRKAIGILSLQEGTGDEVFDLLSGNVKVSVDDKTGARKVTARMKDESGADIDAPLSDYVKNWAEKSAVAKRVLAAPRTSGGGAQGATGPGSIGGPKGLEQQYVEAQARGDVDAMMSLKARLAAELRK